MRTERRSGRHGALLFLACGENSNPCLLFPRQARQSAASLRSRSPLLCGCSSPKEYRQKIPWGSVVFCRLFFCFRTSPNMRSAPSGVVQSDSRTLISSIWAVLAAISLSYFATTAASSTSSLAFFFRDAVSSCWCSSAASPVSFASRSIRSVSVRPFRAKGIQEKNGQPLCRQAVGQTKKDSTTTEDHYRLNLDSRKLYTV